MGCGDWQINQQIDSLNPRKSPLVMGFFNLHKIILMKIMS
jgi:hypothetical protein